MSRVRVAAAAPGRSRRGGPSVCRRGAGAAGVSGQAACTPVLRSADRRSASDDRPSGGRSRPDRRSDVPELAYRVRRHHLRCRPDSKDVVAGRRRYHVRIGADALSAAQHGLHFLAGRLRHGLPVLCHWPGRIDSQPIDGGDPRAGACRRRGVARRLRRSVVECGVHGYGGSRWPTTPGCWPQFSALPRGRRPVSGFRPAR